MPGHIPSRPLSFRPACLLLLLAVQACEPPVGGGPDGKFETGVYQTGTILSLSMPQGAQFIEGSRARIQGATWNFLSGGSFVATLPNSTLGTLHGTYTVSGSQVSIVAQAELVVPPTSSNIAQITGTVDFSQAEPRMQMNYLFQGVTSTVINGVPMTQRNVTETNATLTLVRAQ